MRHAAEERLVVRVVAHAADRTSAPSARHEPTRRPALARPARQCSPPAAGRTPKIGRHDPVPGNPRIRRPRPPGAAAARSHAGAPVVTGRSSAICAHAPSVPRRRASISSRPMPRTSSSPERRHEYAAVLGDAPVAPSHAAPAAAMRSAAVRLEAKITRQRRGDTAASQCGLKRDGTRLIEEGAVDIREDEPPDHDVMWLPRRTVAAPAAGCRRDGDSRSPLAS